MLSSTAVRTLLDAKSSTDIKTVLSSVPTASTSAWSTVFGTYELLEHILLAVPFHDLFVCQRVARSWRDVIRRSNNIQQEMFLLADGSALKPVDDAFNFYAGRTRALYRPAPVRLNPAGEVVCLYNQPSGRGHRLPLATFGISDQNVFLHFDIKGIPVYETKILAQDASGREMLITQPPIVAVNFDFIRREPRGGSLDAYNPTGVTFGDLHDWSVRLAEEYWLETGHDPELSFESISFCLFHPFGKEGPEEAW